jgi:hypothetical protein
MAHDLARVWLAGEAPLVPGVAWAMRFPGDLGPALLNIDPLLISVGLIRFGLPSYFTHVSITTPIVSALKKLLYIELSWSSNGFFKQLLDPGDGVTSETAERRFQK